MLPISLFGMSVAAAELPEMARLAARGAIDGRGSCRGCGGRCARSPSSTCPPAPGYLAFGFLMVGALYRFRSGRFSVEANWLVYLVLCGYTVGLIPTTTSRLLQNTFYALGETRSPARIAVGRVVLAAVLGYAADALARRVAGRSDCGNDRGRPAPPGRGGADARLGRGSWLELLPSAPRPARSVPGALVPWPDLGRMTLLALAAAVPAALVWWALPPLHVALQALAVVGVYALGYLLLARATGAEELGFWLGRFGRRLRN